MARFGWVPKTREVKEKVVNLRKFFEVVKLSLLGNESFTRIACRRLAIAEKCQEIAPGIVVGRMQLEGMIEYNMLNNLKEKYEIAV